MADYSIATILIIFAIISIIVKKTYFAVPIVELKRRARSGDELASQIYRSAAYGGSLSFLLWLVITFCTATSFVLFSKHFSSIVYFFLVVVVLWLAFTWIPKSRVSSLGTKLTLLSAPSIAWVLNYLHPVLSRGSIVASRNYVKPHTGIFEKDDIIALIERQHLQPDNRLKSDELEIIKRALGFTDKVVGDIFVPRKKLKLVYSEDIVGPILIDELHKNGQPLALVSQAKKGPIVGTLQLRKLNLSAQGKVGSIMDGDLAYLHEKDSLSEALSAYYTTNNSVFLVVNNSEEITGLISLHNILDELLGHIDSENFEEYSNLSLVASRHQTVKTSKSEPEIEQVVEV